jgi:hypothetical protein
VVSTHALIPKGRVLLHIQKKEEKEGKGIDKKGEK